MSRTLPFTHHLLAMGQHLERLGQNHAASRLLSRLASFRELPPDVAEETHLHLAELHLKDGRFKEARRKLAAALVRQPDNARYHFLMAGAVEEDDDCDQRRSLASYRRCTKLDPENPAYWCALGLCALRQGETLAGLKALRRAQALAPENDEILSQVAQGLRDAGATAEAKKLLLAALFRHPRDQRFRDLWTDHQFHMLHGAQQETEQPSQPPNKRGPVILPFSRPAPEDTGTRRIRHDLPSDTPGPKQPQRKRLSGKQD
jgi:tetratricopeptide (TPR) repeat protein